METALVNRLDNRFTSTFAEGLSGAGPQRGRLRGRWSAASAGRKSDVHVSGRGSSMRWLPSVTHTALALCVLSWACEPDEKRSASDAGPHDMQACHHEPVDVFVTSDACPSSGALDAKPADAGAGTDGTLLPSEWCVEPVGGMCPDGFDPTYGSCDDAGGCLTRHFIFGCANRPTFDTSGCYQDQRTTRTCLVDSDECVPGNRWVYCSEVVEAELKSLPICDH